jgi:Cu/Ag efflux pump CusA
MAIAIMGGLVSATLLTLAFVPAVYAAWLGIAASQHVAAAPVIQDVD